MKKAFVAVLVALLFGIESFGQDPVQPIDTHTVNGWEVIDHAYTDSFYMGFSTEKVEGETSQAFGFKITKAQPDGYVIVEKELKETMPVPKLVAFFYFLNKANPSDIYTDIGICTYLINGDTVSSFSSIGMSSQLYPEWYPTSVGFYEGEKVNMVSKIRFRFFFYNGAKGFAEILLDSLVFAYPNPLGPTYPKIAVKIDGFEGDPTGVPREIIPGDFALYQNYPNPFNPETKIGFSVSKTLDVKLVIFDVLGREIETLINEEKFPGEYSVKFDGTNLPSGTYLCRLRVGENTRTIKMTLIK